MRFLFALFIAIPILEMVVLIQVGQQIGALWTIVLVLLTAFIGINLLRYQGLSTLSRATWRMQSGQIPAQEMLEGILLAVGGALLLTPGFVTDTIGFLLLVPFTQQFFASRLMGRFKSFASANAAGGGFGAGGFSKGGFNTDINSDQSIIDGEFEVPKKPLSEDKLE
ncbi:MAG: FxsA family protein [Oceanospirillaceae bacterium]